MRARLLPGLALATVITLSGCMADDYQANSGTGRVSVDVSIDSEVKDAAFSRTTASTISAADLMIRLSAEDGSFSKEWKFNEFPSDGEYVIGNYLMEAYYGAADNEGFDNPYYYGSTTFQIKHNQTSSISFEVGLGNSMITLGFEESFKNYLEDFSALLTSTSGKPLEYAAEDEGTPIYVKSGQVSLALNCTLPTGTSGSFHVADFTVDPKNHYKMTLGINFGDPSNPNPGAGAASLTITFDEALQQEPITIELSEELFNAPAPVITPSFDTTQALTLAEGDPATENLGMTLVAQGDFSKVVISTEAPSLVKLGWPSEIDLVSASQAERDNLKKLGLMVLGLYQNPEQMAQLDFTNVVSNLSYIEGESNDNVFTVKVTDKNGKESAAASFTVTTKEIKCDILSHFMVIDSDNLVLNISYTGANIQDNVKFSYLSELGSYAQFKVNSCKDNGDGTYTYDLTTSARPKDPNNITVKITYKGKELVKELECGVPDFSVSAYDSFATYALVDFDCEFVSENLLQQLNLFLSQDGGEYTAVTTEKVPGTNHLKILGLTPNTSYSVKGTLLGKDGQKEASFTTEATAQLPNNGMEDWFRVDGKTKYWWVEYPGEDSNAVWGTMNLLTTSEGGSNISKLSGSRDGMSYCAFSGTRSTTDSYSGNAAIIETVGWGKGNSAAGNSNGCKNFTVGQLYLGSYNSDTKSPNYGYGFSSRPASLSFYYKYSAYNSADYGTALIQVLNSEGAVISENKTSLNAQDSYQLVTLPLSYSANDKAARIIVAFTSSGNESCQNKANQNMTTPFASDDGRYTGSSLYIDEIVLNY